jgi:hypothetical protein
MTLPVMEVTLTRRTSGSLQSRAGQVPPELSSSSIVNRAALMDQGRVVQRAVHVTAFE